MVTYHGSELVVAGKTDNTVAFSDADQAQSVTIDFDGGLHNIHQLGSRDPYEIKAGHKAFDISLTRHYETGNFSSCGATLAALAEASTEIYLAVFPEGDASPKILLNNVKLGTWSLGQDLDGETTETVTGHCLSMTIS